MTMSPIILVYGSKDLTALFNHITLIVHTCLVTLRPKFLQLKVLPHTNLFMTFHWHYAR